MVTHKVTSVRGKSKYQNSFKFFVKKANKKYMVEKLGWCIYTKSQSDKSLSFLRPMFLVLDLKKFSIWGKKQLGYEKRAFTLMYKHGLVKDNFIKESTKVRISENLRKAKDLNLSKD